MPQPTESEGYSDWLEPDYFRRPHPLRRLRRGLIGAAAVGTLLAVAWTLWPGTPTVYQAGPLSSAHAMFHDQCQVCHTESFRTAERFWPGHAGISTVADTACLRCHPGALHNAQQVSTPGCASCHREHQGKRQLAHVSDNHCTSCHANLQRKDRVTPTVIAEVSDFARQHPEFALWRSPTPDNPIRLHFNHQVHLNPTGIADGARQTVKLECQSCHQPDRDWRYLKAPNYQQHCSNCHPLSVQLAGDWKNEAAQKAAEQYRQQPAPHQPPVEVRAVLRERLLMLAAKTPALLDGTNAPSDPRLPGEAAAPATKVASDAWVKDQLEVSERMLFRGAGGCAFCHVPTTTAAAPLRADRLPQYEPTRIPSRWLTRGEFNHHSHQMLGCVACHPATESQKSSDVLIPRIDVCRSCHTPQVRAPSACSDCHRYHDHRRDSEWTGHFTIPQTLGQAPISP